MFQLDSGPVREGDIQKDLKVADVANGRKMFFVQQRSEQISEGRCDFLEISSHVGKTLKYFCALVSRLYSDITSQIGFFAQFTFRTRLFPGRSWRGQAQAEKSQKL